MKSKTSFKFSAVLSLFVVALFLASCTQTQAPQTEEKRPATDSPTGVVYTVEITSEGYSPSELNLKSGDAVIFTNRDTASHWIATANHPTHLGYPGSDIRLCGSTEQDTIFDACKGLETGESFTFVFYEKGSWPYHDHLNVAPPFFGRITVE